MGYWGALDFVNKYGTANNKLSSENIRKGLNRSSHSNITDGLKKLRKDKMIHFERERTLHGNIRFLYWRKKK